MEKQHINHINYKLTPGSVTDVVSFIWFDVSFTNLNQIQFLTSNVLTQFHQREECKNRETEDEFSQIS